MHSPRLITVEDLDDAALRDYRSLTDVELRRVVEPAEGLFIAESAGVIRQALAAGYRLRSVLATPRWLEDLPDVVGAAGAQGAPVLAAEEAVLEQITGFHLHRGALAAVQRPALRPVEELVAGCRRIALLADLSDHANVGALFRSAAALGVEAVLVTPRCADPLYRRSVRVSMGAVFAVPWTRTGRWPHMFPELTGLGFTTAALGLTPQAVDLDTLASDPPERLCWILGAEGHGLSPRAMSMATHTVRIPMAAGVDSLNVGAAGAIAFWSTRP